MAQASLSLLVLGSFLVRVGPPEAVGVFALVAAPDIEDALGHESAAVLTASAAGLAVDGAPGVHAGVAADDLLETAAETAPDAEYMLVELPVPVLVPTLSEEPGLVFVAQPTSEFGATGLPDLTWQMNRIASPALLALLVMPVMLVMPALSVLIPALELVAQIAQSVLPGWTMAMQFLTAESPLVAARADEDPGL
ncbi:hypothetical protein DL771_000555 [Monosporascus sp. 5C6A]|nr:hypothetical protein DL771_000555 [Monosporascus sp. 5C6A]